MLGLLSIWHSAREYFSHLAVWLWLDNDPLGSQYYSAQSVKKNLMFHDFLGIYPGSKIISLFQFFTSTPLIMMRQKIKFINLFPQASLWRD
jgi:hypothetical protein